MGLASKIYGTVIGKRLKCRSPHLLKKPAPEETWRLLEFYWRLELTQTCRTMSETLCATYTACVKWHCAGWLVGSTGIRVQATRGDCSETD